MKKLTNKQVYPAAFYFLRVVFGVEESETIGALDVSVSDNWQIEELALLGYQNKTLFPDIWRMVVEDIWN